MSSADRSDRLVKIVGGAIVVALVAGIVGAALWSRRDRAGYADSAALPLAVRSDYGVPLGTGASGVPVLEIWEDFQCPACAALERAAGAHIRDLIAAGKVNIIWRPTAFLDDNPTIRQANRDNDAPDSSKRAIAAWGCAIDLGKTEQFHDALFASQPQEGTGYSSAVLKLLGAQLGLTAEEAKTYAACVDSDKYVGWAKNSTLKFRDAGIPGTPTVFLNGKELTLDQVADSTTLDRLIAEATK